MHPALMLLVLDVFPDNLVDEIGRCCGGIAHLGFDFLTRHKGRIIAGLQSANYTNDRRERCYRSTARQSANHKTGFSMIVLHTSAGDITLKLDHDKAPISAANFVEYAKAGHYDGTIFHRVIDNFMIQGGGFEPGLKQKKVSNPIQNEADNGLRNETGTIAMARTMEPHSATAQFFINVNDNSFLNHSGKTPQGWGYAVFGKVTDGMDVVNSIKGCETGSMMGHQDVPKEDIVINSVTVSDE